MNTFYEKQYSEWYCYLRRDNKPTFPAAEGSTFKGPFHLKRMLIIMLDKMLKDWVFGTAVMGTHQSWAQIDVS